MGQGDFWGNGYLSLTEKDVDEVVNFVAKRVVGRVCKRFEIHNNIPVLKTEVKELLYEQFRDLSDLLVSTGKGLHVTSFNIKSNENNKGEKHSA